MKGVCLQCGRGGSVYACGSERHILCGRCFDNELADERRQDEQLRQRLEASMTLDQRLPEDYELGHD